MKDWVSDEPHGLYTIGTETDMQIYSTSYMFVPQTELWHSVPRLKKPIVFWTWAPAPEDGLSTTVVDNFLPSFTMRIDQVLISLW